MTTQTIGTAVAERDRQRDNSPRGLINEYRGDFAAVLPSHIKPATWVRIAQGALKKGKKQGDRFELEIAAANNPAAFLSALLDAARQGLEPGTEQYYLTPRKVKGRLEILGITGYQGHIEMIYRAGAVSTVVAEVVREKDSYRYRRGVDEVPVHDFPPFAGESTRGKLIGVYAYARMKDGAASRVVELGQDAIDRIKKYSQGSDSEFSPWVNHEESMWLKSSVRQLQKWVPTSSEYLEHQARAAGMAMGAAEAERNRVGVPPLRAEQDLGASPDSNREFVFEGEVVDPATGEVAEPEPISPGQRGRLFALYQQLDVTDRDDRLADAGAFLGRDVPTSSGLTAVEASALIYDLERRITNRDNNGPDNDPDDDGETGDDE